MSKLSPDVISKFGQLQEQIWQNVNAAVAATADPAPTFVCEVPEAVPPEVIRAMAGQTVLAIQFAFASTPDHNQLVVFPNDLFIQIASLIKNEDVTQPDESLVPEIRDFLEAIVQGICLACGIAKNEPMVASGLSIRYQALTLPDNFGRNEDIVKVEVSLTAPNIEGQLSWYLDNPTITFVTGEAGEEETANEAMQTMAAQGSGFGLQPQDRTEDVGGLDLLLDIPLEISVELGRVKMLVKDVVELGTGSIVEIDKAAGEPVDVMVNGRLVARGEVVVIEDNFGVRITEILNAQDRITKLNEAA